MTVLYEHSCLLVKGWRSERFADLHLTVRWDTRLQTSSPPTASLSAKRSHRSPLCVLEQRRISPLTVAPGRAEPSSSSTCSTAVFAFRSTSITRYDLRTAAWSPGWGEARMKISGSGGSSRIPCSAHSSQKRATSPGPLGWPVLWTQTLEGRPHLPHTAFALISNRVTFTKASASLNIPISG